VILLSQCRILGGRARPAAPLRIMGGPAGRQAVSGEDEDVHEDEEDPDVLMTQREEE
jgi:hypothetical protein